MENLREIESALYRQELNRFSPSQSQLDRIWQRISSSYDQIAITQPSLAINRPKRISEMQPQDQYKASAWSSRLQRLSVAAVLVFALFTGLIYYTVTKPEVNFNPLNSTGNSQQPGVDSQPLAVASKIDSYDQDKQQLKLLRQAPYPNTHMVYPEDPVLLDHPLAKDQELPQELPVYILDDIIAPNGANASEQAEGIPLLYEPLRQSLANVNQALAWDLDLDQAVEETLPEGSMSQAALSARSKNESKVVMAAYASEGIVIYVFPTQLSELSAEWPEYTVKQAIMEDYHTLDLTDLLQRVNSQQGPSMIERMDEENQNVELRQQQVNTLVENSLQKAQAVTKSWQDVLPWSETQKILPFAQRGAFGLPEAFYGLLYRFSYPAANPEQDFPEVMNQPEEPWSQELLNSVLRKITWHTKNELVLQADGSYMLEPYMLPVPASLTETYQQTFPEVRADKNSTLFEARPIAYSFIDYTDQVKHVNDYSLKTPEEAESLISESVSAPLNANWKVIATGMSYRESFSHAGFPRYLIPCYDFVVQADFAEINTMENNAEAIASGSDAMVSIPETTGDYSETKGATFEIPESNSESEEGNSATDELNTGNEILPTLRMTISIPAIDSNYLLYKGETTGNKIYWENEAGEPVLEETLPDAPAVLIPTETPPAETHESRVKGIPGTEDSDPSQTGQSNIEPGINSQSNDEQGNTNQPNDEPGNTHQANDEPGTNSQSNDGQGKTNQPNDEPGTNQDGIRLFAAVGEDGKLTVSVFNKRTDSISIGRDFILQKWDGNQWVNVTPAYANTDEMLSIEAGQSQDLNNLISNYITSDEYRVQKSVFLADGSQLDLVVDVWKIMY
ncbi:MAG: hypothetical protein Q4E09_05450 [Eubacteriales bacterium]|nr:hypothetical protein [Eubacteriales bacterium]